MNPIVLKLLSALPEIATLAESVVTEVESKDDTNTKISKLADDAIALIKDGLTTFLPGK